MAAEFLSEAELMERLGISKDALDRLVQSGRLHVSERLGERAFSVQEVSALQQSGQLAAEPGPQPIAPEPSEPEERRETELDLQQAAAAEEEEEAIFDFTEEPEVEGAGEEAPAEEVSEREMVTDVVELGEQEAGEEDILGVVIEDVEALTDEITAEPSGEETVDVPATEEATAEITQLDEEALESEELEQMLAGEEEPSTGMGGLGEFEVPAGAPVAAGLEVPMPRWAVLLLAVSLLVLLLAGWAVMANALSPKYSLGLAKLLGLS